MEEYFSGIGVAYKKFVGDENVVDKI